MEVLETSIFAETPHSQSLRNQMFTIWRSSGMDVTWEQSRTAACVGEEQAIRFFFALPETRVTLHSGDMGDTLPCKGGVSCRGRSVTSWTIASGSWLAGSTARRWHRCAKNSGSPGRRATRSMSATKIAALED